ncbi:MAG TPA: ABC transporter permease [Myxococcota bacterium]|nr:ABC transporter permease [Myxococcota bacterium]
MRIEAPRGWMPLELGELWRSRELAVHLALRDIQIRYKQSLLGVGWAVLQPLLTTGIFAVLFSLLLGPRGLPTPDGIPYAVSTFCALAPWQLFATSLTASGRSVAASQQLVTKVYFPRLLIPLAPVLSALVDFAVTFAVLLVMLLVCGITPGPAVLALPLFVALAALTALAASLWLSALNAVYRDVQLIIPFLVQIWMYATPVVYTTESVMRDQPAWVRALYGLNPMASVVEGFRWALLGTAPPQGALLAGSLAMVALLLVGGAFYFRRMERVFADLV